MSSYVKFNPFGYFCPNCGHSLKVEVVTEIYYCPRCKKSYRATYFAELETSKIKPKVEFVFR